MKLETLAVVWTMQHLHAYLYRHNIQVVMDNSALLGAPSSSGKHTWWQFGKVLRKVDILYRPGKKNIGAHAFSRNPLRGSTPRSEESDVQVAAVLST